MSKTEHERLTKLLGAAFLLSCALPAAVSRYGHMDFTFSAKEELGYYVLSLMSAKE